jgi:hypothetical protein
VDIGVIYSVALDGAGNVYMLLTDQHALAKMSPSGTFTRLAGNGALGFGCQQGPAPITQFDYRAGGAIAVDKKGTVYAGGLLVTCLHLVADGVAKAVPGTAGFRVRAATFDTAGSLYIIDGPAVKKFANGTFTTIAGGSNGFNGESGPATQVALAAPAGVAIDSAGNLYIADTANNRIRKVSDGVMSTIAGGVSGFSGDNGPAKDAQLSAPTALAVDSAGVLYVADTGNHRVRKIANGVITTVSGTGVAGFSCDNCLASSAQLNTPTGLAVDPASRLLIIRLLQQAPTGSV